MRTSVLSMWMTGYRAQHWLNDTEALSEFVAVLRCFWNNKDIEAAHLLLHATEMLHPQCSYTMDRSSSRLRNDLENFFTTVKSSLDHLWAHYATDRSEFETHFLGAQLGLRDPNALIRMSDAAHQ
eukprot:950767-Pleurochrysis_carterae.AAC.1